jgi:hypothetical protein
MGEVTGLTAYYKVLDIESRSRSGSRDFWPLPANGQPGEWMRKLKTPLRACQHGWHLCEREWLWRWLGPVIYEAEGLETRGTIVLADKTIFESARLVRRLHGWNEWTALNFSADCIEYIARYWYGALTCEIRDYVKTTVGLARYAGESADAFAELTESRRFIPSEKRPTDLNTALWSMCSYVGHHSPTDSAALVAERFYALFVYEGVLTARAKMTEWLFKYLEGDHEQR